MEVSQRNYSIDVLRLICSFMVITLHFPLSGFWGDEFKNIARAAVPVFFMISGYFTYDNNSEIFKLRIIRQLKHIVSITIGAIIFYLVFNIVIKTIDGESVWKYIMSLFDVKHLMQTVFLNTSFLSAHLWFLYALICVMIFIYFVHKYRFLDKVYIFIPMLMIMNLVLGCYSGFIFNRKFMPDIVRNCWLTGIPYYLIGIYIRTHKLPKLNSFFLTALIAGFCFSTVIETMFITKFEHITYFEHFISTIGLSISLFLMAVNNPGNSNLLSTAGRRYSFYIYILQMALGYIILRLYPGCPYLSVDIFLVGLIIAIPVSFFCDRIRKKCKVP